jgi:uncharacterized protein (DUF2252 family)
VESANEAVSNVVDEGELPVMPTQRRGRAAAVEHLSEDERAARGKAARKKVPRASLGVWDPPSNRPDPVGLLRGQESVRVPELVPIRHERMLVSPFAFYRGAAVVMASDLAIGPRSGLPVQCCGDAHLVNFGGFSAPDRQMVFDVNDFDETSKGPFEWDVKRLVASFEIARRANGFEDGAESFAEHAARAYREAMTEFATMRNLDVWYSRLDAEGVINRWAARVSQKNMKRFERTVAKARSKDSLRAFDRLTERVDGEIRIASDPPLVSRLADLAESEAPAGTTVEEVTAWVHEQFRGYRSSLQPDRRQLLEGYELVDIARKVVGVGSVGTRCWIVLMLGKDEADPLFLQVKEAEPSVLEAHAGKSKYRNHGQRVVEGQRLLQASSDILLGWFRTPTPDGPVRDFYVRQLWDGKLSPDIDNMTPEALAIFAEMCGWTLARGHARSGDRIAIAAYLGSGSGFDRAMGEFALAYADQNDRDYQAMVAAFGAAATTAPSA